MNILIVEDNEDSRILLISFLESKGHTVTGAANGRHGLELARATPPDIIISDILMPEMDGYALCRACKEDPTLSHIPFVFYTATYTDAADERFAMSLGASRFLVKPMDMDLLLAEIEAILDEYRRRELPVPPAPLAPPPEIDRLYAEVLTRKLDKKTRELKQDIEERRRVEAERRDLERLLQQSQKLEAIGTLAGGIAHDFNNILTPIIGYSELLANNLEANDPDNAAYAREVLTAAYRAKKLTNQILTFSRGAEEDKKIIDPRPIVKEALKLLRSTIPATVEIRPRLADDCGMVEADPTKIHQLLMNLCTNAYHAIMDGGAGVIEVELTATEIKAPDYDPARTPPPGRYLRLRVADSGCGIAPDDLKRIFDPYFTTKPKEQGTGLGLAVVHGIVKGHGGHIFVNSTPGEGTMFSIYLPSVDVCKTKTEEGGQAEISTGSERILVVDDEEINTTVISRMLAALGYRPTAATSPAAGLELFEEDPEGFDLVITDMTMPVMTGVELAQQILARRADTPILLCSGFSEAVNAARAKAVGVRGYIMKPILLRELAQAVRETLRAPVQGRTGRKKELD